jgi:hypothetical protein
MADNLLIVKIHELLNYTKWTIDEISWFLDCPKGLVEQIVEQRWNEITKEKC